MLPAHHRCRRMKEKRCLLHISFLTSKFPCKGDGVVIYSGIPALTRMMSSELRAGPPLMGSSRFKESAASLDQALSIGNTMASKGSAGRRLTPDPKVIA
jgi:hypothetical protein